MTSIVDRKIRFSTAAFAIDATPKSLRNWLARGQLGFPGSVGNDGGWVSFSLVDISILAVTRKLVDFGVKVEEASRQARAAVLGPLFKGGNGLNPRNEDIGEEGINTLFQGLMLICWPDPNYAFGWQSHLMRVGEELSPPVNAYLAIAFDDVVATALRRTREHLAGSAAQT
jgi:hypothetical protein